MLDDPRRSQARNQDENTSTNNDTIQEDKTHTQLTKVKSRLSQLKAMRRGETNRSFLSVQVESRDFPEPLLGANNGDLTRLDKSPEQTKK